MGKKPDTLTHLTADTLVAKNDPRLAFRAVLDSTIALTVWLQIELAEPWQPWLTDIRSRLGNIMRADALEEPLAAQSIAGFSEAQLHRLSINRCVTTGRSPGAGGPPWARCRAA